MAQSEAVEYAGTIARGRRQWARGGLLVLIPVLMAGAGIAVLVYLGVHIGVQALTVGAVAAMIPVPVLVACFLWLDRYEPEPIKYLAVCLCWGATVAAGLALVLNQTAVKVIHLPLAVVAVATAPLAEESMKALGPLLLFLLRPSAFSGVVDGIVYCGLSATGFAMLENILYLGGYGYAAGADRGGVAGGVAQVIGIFFVRIALSGFAHPLFTAMTGIGLGVAARSGSKKVRILAPIAGWLTAMLLHGSWNLMAELASHTKQYLILLYGYFAVMMPIFLGMVGFALWLRSWEGRLTQRMLPDYVRAGWLSPPEVDDIVQWISGQILPTAEMKTCLKKPPRLYRSGEVARQYAYLLTAISGYRSVYTGRDPQTPEAHWDGQRYHIRFPDGAVRPFDPPEQPVVPVPVALVPYYR